MKKIMLGLFLTVSLSLLAQEQFPGSTWVNKKIVWYGTSIPAQGYPQVVGKYLGAMVYNESAGASSCRRGRRVYSSDPLGDIYGIQNVDWPNVLYSLSMTQEEKHDIFINWTREERHANLLKKGYTKEQIKDVPGFGEMMRGEFFGDKTDETNAEYPHLKPIDVMNSKYVEFRKRCYSLSWNTATDIEKGFGVIPGKVEKYLNEQDFPDLWVFDHGHNDYFSDDPYEKMNIFPSDIDNRNTFLGAMSFIFRKILAYNPRARIVIIGHYTNQVGGTNRPDMVVKAQQVLADYWQFPFFKLWENVPISQAVVTTTGYYDKEHVWHDIGYNGKNHFGMNFSQIDENPRQRKDGTWVHDMSLKQIWFWDDLHPWSKEALDLIGKTIAKWINNY